LFLCDAGDFNVICQGPGDIKLDDTQLEKNACRIGKIKVKRKILIVGLPGASKTALAAAHQTVHNFARSDRRLAG
jgi:hypothetical protein